MKIKNSTKMIKLEEKYNLKVNHTELCEKLERIIRRSRDMRDKDLFRKIFSLIDLTSLDVSDTEEKIMNMVNRVNKFPSKFRDIPNVAALCVYPVFVPLVKEHLKVEGVKLASVAGSFPSSMTFTEVKLAEVKKVIEEGADEVDIVMSVGKFLEGKYEFVYDEIQKIKSITGEKHLKVILETGVLSDPEKIKLASFLCLEAGADFIKTSTGKNSTGASPEAVYIMSEAIREFHKKTGKKAGIKPAGGISDAGSAIQHYLIVSEVLGNDWTKSEFFRIGASKLANNLLGEKYF